MDFYAMRSSRALWLVGLWFVVAAGCKQEEKLYQVSGTVTHEGAPVPAGLVFFDPDPSQGTEGTQGFANIKEGKYTTAVDGQGVRGGDYVVRVLGFDGKPADEAPFGQPLFDEYSTTKQLPQEDTVVDFALP